MTPQALSVHVQKGHQFMRRSSRHLQSTKYDTVKKLHRFGLFAAPGSPALQEKGKGRNLLL